MRCASWESTRTICAGWGSYPGVEEMCLDFAIRRRDIVAQSDLFPAELLWQAGALDIDLVVTHYAIAEEES